MTSILIIGDIHLGKGLKLGKPGIGGQLNSRIIDTLNLLDWALEEAKERHVSVICLTGDICEDGKPDYFLIYYFFEWLKKCEVENIEVHIVTGNHDLKRNGKFLSSYLDLISMAEFPHVFVYKEIKTVFFDNLSITFVPYTDRRALHVDSNAKAIEEIQSKLDYNSFLLDEIETKIIIGHLSLEGSIYVGDEFNDYSNEIFCPLTMFVNYDYVWMGHVHKYQVISQKPYISHTGSLDISDFGECDHIKNLIHFEKNHITEIPVPSRSLCRLNLNFSSNDLENKSSTQLIIDEIEKSNVKKSLKNAILKLDVSYESQNSIFANRKEIENYFYSLGGFHISIFSEKKQNQEIIKSESTIDMDHSLAPKNATKLYIENLSFSDERKSKLIEFCDEIFEEYQEKYESLQ